MSAARGTNRSATVDADRVRALVAWFDDSARDLPWRHGRTGYTALVSEAMLQQTQVARVVDRFTAFMDRFPDVASLAAADEEDVLSLWQGLGYYRRARNLHAAARMIVDDMNGAVPRDVAALKSLPGVGPYTAGAIASIVHDERTPIVDGNVHRVLSRWDARSGPASDGTAMARTWQRAAEVVEHATRPGTLNEALMELGATVCTPKRPLCEACPVRTTCKAFATGEPESIPGASAAPPRSEVHHHVVIIRRRARLLVEQRPSKGLWSNMWQPPAVEGLEAMEPAAVAEAFAERGLPLVRLAAHSTFTHETTHRRVGFNVYTATTRMRRGEWADAHRLKTLPMSAAHRRAIETMYVAMNEARRRVPAKMTD